MFLTHPMINTAVKAARLAGEIINRASFDVGSLKIEQKQANDFVTEVDRASEDIIIETLLSAYPNHGIIGEESGNSKGKINADYVWIIDPLDGTTNFLHNFPYYCVSIALAFKGKIEQAVIYDPNKNDLFTAVKGSGAFLNDKRIRVSNRSQFSDCLLASGHPFSLGGICSNYLKVFEELTEKASALRRSGAAALDLAYVAAGFNDGYFEGGLKIWDIAAGSLLVTEAGGLVGNFTGEADFLEQKECIAANPKIYAQMVNILKKYSKFN